MISTLGLCFVTALAAACIETTTTAGPASGEDIGGGNDPGGDDPGGGNDPGGGDDPGGGQDARVSQRTGRGSSLAVDEEHRTLAVANKATHDVTLFDLPDLVFRAHIPVGKEPVSVTFSPDGKTLYVVNRGSKSVSIIDGVDGRNWVVRREVPVGSEPTSGALSPTGASLYVANWADGTMSVINTRTANVEQVVELGGAPYAVCVSNDFDSDDADEAIYVTDFYSRPIAGTREAEDGSRAGRLFKLEYDGRNYQSQSIILPPVLVKGIDPEIDEARTEAFPNQLYACNVNQGYVYISSVGASPAAFAGGVSRTDFRQNIHGLVHVVDETSGTYLPQKTVNLSELVAAQQGTKRFAAVPHDLAFVDKSDLAYIVILTANAVLRVNFGENPPIAGEPLTGTNFLETKPSPTGIAISGSTAYVYNEVDRSVSRLDLAKQAADGDAVESKPLPRQGSEEFEALEGQKFFNTALARWSTGAWVGCVGCHPFGTTDNVTWVFPTGPRQTVDTSATYDKLGEVQRILNWSAIFDEVHDFDLNTRTVANGVGAIVSDPGLDNGNRLNFVGTGGVADPTNGFNVGSVKQFNEVNGVLPDWDQIEKFIATIRVPHGRTTPTNAIERGRQVFDDANCEYCHAGVLWTLSERYYEPILNGDLRATTFAEAGINSLQSVFPSQTVIDDIGFDNTPLIGNDANGAPQRHFCVVRDVGTYAALGPDDRGADEVRDNGGNAQGVDGFNVPSLLNVNTGAPYLHNGAAETLEKLLDPNGPFETHLRAGNVVFTPTTEDIANLIAFIRSIDDTTPIFQILDDHQLCPQGVEPRVESGVDD